MNDLLTKQQEGENISSYMNSVKKCICRIQNNILEGNKIRSRVESIVEEERTSMYHIAKEKQNENKKYIKKLCDPNGKYLNTIPEIRNEVERYYKDLYSKQVTSVSAQSQILKSVNTHLSLEDTAEIEADITENEVELAIRTARIKSSPGPDGIGYGFYRKFWPVTKEVLVKVLNSVLNAKQEKSGFSDGIIILIPKGKKVDSIDKFRPITLLNADYKIFMKILANRLKPVMANLIGLGQNCGVVGRNIMDNLCTVRNTIMFHETDMGSQAALLSIDLQKAFDRIDHAYLEAVLKNLTFQKSLEI
mgnify:FL=1